MARRCFERLDDAGIAGTTRVLRVLSDTDNVGTARFETPRAGRYDIVVSHPAFATADRKGLRPAKTGATVVRVPLALDPNVPERISIE